jgi:hypothetical protein
MEREGAPVPPDSEPKQSGEGEEHENAHDQLGMWRSLTPAELENMEKLTGGNKYRKKYKKTEKRK